MNHSPSSLSIVPSQPYYDSTESASDHIPILHESLKKIKKTVSRLLPRFLLNRGISSLLRLISSRSTKEEEGVRFVEALVRAFLTFVT